MKTFFIVALLLLSFTCYSQTDSVQKSSVYIARATGFTGSARKFKIFIDGNLGCKIQNDTYLILDITPGQHSFAVQMDGQKLNSNTEEVSLLIEAGKEYYLTTTLETNGMWGVAHIEELSQNSGKTKIAKLKKSVCQD